MLKNSENTNLLKLFNSLNKMEEYEVMFLIIKETILCQLLTL